MPHHKEITLQQVKGLACLETRVECGCVSWYRYHRVPLWPACLVSRSFHGTSVNYVSSYIMHSVCLDDLEIRDNFGEPKLSRISCLISAYGAQEFDLFSLLVRGCISWRVLVSEVGIQSSIDPSIDLKVTEM